MCVGKMDRRETEGLEPWEPLECGTVPLMGLPP